MSEHPIRLVNEDGTIVGKDPETGETVPISIDLLETARTTVDERLSAHSIAADRGTIEDRLTYADGRVVEEGYEAWTHRLPEYLNALPYDRTDKGIISFGWDDTAVEEYSEAFPEFRDRGIPFGLYASARRIQEGGTRWGTDAESNDDLDAAVEMVSLGAEILNHGAEHRNLDEYDWEGAGYDSHEAFLIDEVLNGKRELLEHGFNCHSFLARGGSDINTGQLDEFKSRLIRSTHLMSADGFSGAIQPRHVRRYAASRQNMDDLSAAEVIDAIDRAADFGMQLEFYGHARGWDWGSGDTQKLQEILDHAQALRANGEIDIATPTTARLVPGDLRSVNFAPNPTADVVDDFADDYWSSFGNDPVIATGEGSAGPNYWRFGADVDPDGDGLGYGGLHEALRWGPHYHAIQIECDARGAAGGETLSVRNDYRSGDFGEGQEEVERSLTTSWETYYVTVGYTRRETKNRLIFWTRDDEVHLDNLRLYPV